MCYRTHFVYLTALNRFCLPTGMEIPSSTIRIIFFVVFVTLQWHPAYGDLVKCQDHCSSGSCCEVKQGLINCCPFNNGVCCSNRKSCCPQGSACSLSDSSCKYPSGISMFMAVLTESQKPTKLRTNDVPVILCPDKISFCPSSAECCQIIGGFWGCCDQNTKSNSLRPKADWAASPAVFCPGEQLACPSNATCCQTRHGLWACCNHANAKCCSDGLHCCPHGTECSTEDESCTPIGKHGASDLESILSNTIVWPSVRPSRKSVEHYRWGLKNREDWNRTMSDVMAYHDVLCDDGKHSCPSKTSCCPDGNEGFTCCPLEEATCCSDRQHCCPAGFSCDLSSETCVKQEFSVKNSVSVVCPNAEFSCLNGSSCCPLPNDEWACCPFENAVCCSDLMHCCPQNFVCDVDHGQCVNNTIVAKSDRAGGVCQHGLIACPTGTCCSNNEGIDSCCPYPDAVCCPNERCCPSGTECDSESGGCKKRSSIPWSKKVQGIRSPIVGGESGKIEFQLKQHDTICPDKESVCTDNKTCCLLIDHSFGCCPLPNGVCCSDGKHCCPFNSICTEDSRCVLRRLNALTQPLIDAGIMVPVAGNPIPSAYSLPAPIARATVHATWCGACGTDGFCCPNAQGSPDSMCCTLPMGVCCPDGAHCCPRGSQCVGGGKCELIHMHTQTYAPSYLVPPVGHATRSAFLHSIDPKSLVFSITAPLASKAKLDPLFLIKKYYSWNVGRFTVCPDLQRVCSLDQKCCLSAQFGYTCVSVKDTCCSASNDTYCPSGSNCTADGLGCVSS